MNVHRQRSLRYGYLVEMKKKHDTTTTHRVIITISTGKQPKSAMYNRKMCNIHFFVHNLRSSDLTAFRHNFCCCCCSLYACAFSVTWTVCATAVAGCLHACRCLLLLSRVHFQCNVCGGFTAQRINDLLCKILRVINNTEAYRAYPH